MAHQRRKSTAKCDLCFSAILFSFFSATLLAQTSSEFDAHQFSSSTFPFLSYSQSLDQGASDFAAVPLQDSSQNDTKSSSSRQQNDWVHSWMRKVDKTRASQ